MERVVSSPRRYILWPASISFILSYPFLYTLLTASLPVKNLEKPVFVPTLPFDESTHSSNSLPPYSEFNNSVLNVKQIYLSPPILSNALSLQFLDSVSLLIEDLLPESQKLNQLERKTRSSNGNGVDEEDYDEYDDYLSLTNPTAPKINKLPYLHYYHPPSSDADLSLLPIALSSPLLKSVLYLPKPPHYNEPIASGLLISYFYNDTEDEARWTNAIEKILSATSSNSPKKSIRSFIQDQVSFLLPTFVKNQNTSFSSYVRSLPFAFFPYCPLPLLNVFVTYTLLTIYLLLSWDISSIQSKAGLFVAFMAQIMLTLSSAFTIISYFFPTFSHDSIRHFLIIPYFIAVISIENISRILNAVGRSPHENPPISRIRAGFLSSFEQTCKIVFTDMCILFVPCIPIFAITEQVKHLCLFTALCLFIDLVLHATYFTAILSIDLRRFELEDLITENFSGSSQPSTTFLTFLNAEKNLPSFLKPHYLYLRHLYFHPKISLSTFVLTGMLLFVYMWASLTDPANHRFYSSGRIPFFFSQLTPTSEIFAKHAFVRLFEPIVIKGLRVPFISRTSKIAFALGSPIMGTYPQFIRLLSVNVMLELIASIAFILSLTGVILKYMLPPQTDRPSNPEARPVIEFFSKDLIGFHTLDVLQVISDGSTISTVSLDHRICIWNASLATVSNRVVKPVPIPLPSDFWPVTKVVLNSSMSMIVIFSSRIAGIRCWDYKNNKLLYHLQDRKLFNASPIETFFSGSDLIVVTKACTVITISETGQSSQFPVEFPSTTAKVIHAKRLLTPRIPERVICMSSENEITIGTHIGRSWRFRKLMIQESPIQFNLHTLQSQGVHDLSKYKPQPIPAPQAMMARRPMRPSRLAAMKNDADIPPRRRPKILDDKVVALVPVPAINMVLIATSVHACLFDAQTGIIVKHFQIGHLTPTSLRAFHSQPTHCRFCGCVSVDTFSIAYSDAEHDGLVICHTLTIDNRAKNSICIRVERDPRETRCLGFEATTERQHWIDHVEGWDTTDMNLIMGVRRKDSLSLSEPKSLNSSVAESSSSLMTSITEGLRQRRKKHQNTHEYSKVNNTSYKQEACYKQETPSVKNLLLDWLSIGYITHNSDLLHVNKRCSTPSKPTLGMTWEGWALSATGQISYYDIPDFDNLPKKASSYEYGNSKTDPSRQTKGSVLSNGPLALSQAAGFSGIISNTIGTELESISYDRLLIRSIGPVTKYGAKSIAVAFGNVIKVLYFGKEESLPSDPLANAPPGNNEIRQPYTHSNLAKYNTSPSNIQNGLMSGSRKWRREVGY